MVPTSVGHLNLRGRMMTGRSFSGFLEVHGVDLKQKPSLMLKTWDIIGFQYGLV